MTIGESIRNEPRDRRASTDRDFLDDVAELAFLEIIELRGPCLQPGQDALGLEDPAAVEGTDTEKWLAFRKTFGQLESRIRIFTSLPFETLDRLKLQERLDDIGSSRDE